MKKLDELTDTQQCVELVCELAAMSSYQQLPQFILQNRDLWRLLEPEARERVAAFPFVVVNLRFKDAEVWQQASGGHLMTQSVSTLYDGVPPKFFEDLALETLLFARQATREDVNVAKVMFAMTSAVASLIASLTVSQVRAIALGNASQVRVRWDNDPEFWGDLLVACRAGDERLWAHCVARATYYSVAKSLRVISKRPTPREERSWGNRCSRIQDSN